MKKITLCLLVMACLLPWNLQALELMLPQVYRDNIDIIGWLMSEKLDGVRGYWDGKRLLSKNGILLHPPAVFFHNFPPFPLEGELWGGRETFEQTVAIVNTQRPHTGWLELKFAIFDVPDQKGGFSERLKIAENWFQNHPSRFAFVIPQKRIEHKGELKTELQRIEKSGGEGVIVRRADTLYSSGRSHEILKVKSFSDTEAVVIAHIGGQGRNRGRLGSLLVELPNKIQFKIGTGFSDEQRDNPPAVGSIITFKYYGLFQSGRPRFPSFLRIRGDTLL
ncbi:MAG: DNA ligase [Proteobacteria bacterium]|nr:DNA ligase [Pseudomonadota bacterium]MBU1061056.1 DNA ligase [Pseudomonadota bacterium]